MTVHLEESRKLPAGYKPTAATRTLYLVVCEKCGPLTAWPMRRVVAQQVAEAHKVACAV